MSLLKRLPASAIQKLEAEEVKYPYVIKDLKKELEAESFWVNLRLEAVMILWNHLYDTENFDMHRFIKLFHEKDAVHQA